ncbi:MAG: hypothetical protein AVDCRST_MAG01-01-1258 [uncultured Rubrobacteraceae bacterium]|uniref:Uncharacterized protein n=1 Tax=uncultured Rubrobacteraceae bacterium TaxID=349277 RepID=A0A6J4P9R0_9ACTN|nr:MAG: hypothetical protein AVDCRST_MAG01-01-1258 [uncultured Rubrobacteraceae bacterium]
MLVLGAVAAASPVALMYLFVNLYAAGISVYFGGDLGQTRLREDFLQPFADFMARGGGLPALYAALTGARAQNRQSIVSDANVMPSRRNASSPVRPRAFRRYLEDFPRGL